VYGKLADGGYGIVCADGGDSQEGLNVLIMVVDGVLILVFPGIECPP